jgi:hypothetical protein
MKEKELKVAIAVVVFVVTKNAMNGGSLFIGSR